MADDVCPGEGTEPVQRMQDDTVASGPEGTHTVYICPDHRKEALARSWHIRCPIKGCHLKGAWLTDARYTWGRKLGRHRA